MQSYWRSPAATEAAFEDGWYKTGDRGRLDATRHLIFLGRQKVMSVLAHRLNGYAQDVEQVLRPIRGVKEAGRARPAD
jgi:long-subunit acyl-CoA synthetase (AMP-forming)